MKKTILLGVIISCALLSKDASSQFLEKGDYYLSAGYGFPNLTGTWFRIYEWGGEINNDFRARSIGPVYLKGEYCIGTKVGIGLNFAWTTSSLAYTYIAYNNNSLVHFQEKLRGLLPVCYCE